MFVLAEEEQRGSWKVVLDPLLLGTGLLTGRRRIPVGLRNSRTYVSTTKEELDLLLLLLHTAWLVICLCRLWMGNRRLGPQCVRGPATRESSCFMCIVLLTDAISVFSRI